jgi:hypothetical protein
VRYATSKAPEAPMTAPSANAVSAPRRQTRSAQFPAIHEEPAESSPVPAVERDAGRRAVPTERRQQPSTTVPSAAPSPEFDSAIEVEVRLIDEARRDVAQGRARDALDALGRYAREAPSRRLAPEAAYLELEANVLLGDHDAAARSARSLLDRYPTGPHAARARKVLGQ